MKMKIKLYDFFDGLSEEATKELASYPINMNIDDRLKENIRNKSMKKAGVILKTVDKYGNDKRAWYKVIVSMTAMAASVGIIMGIAYSMIQKNNRSEGVHVPKQECLSDTYMENGNRSDFMVGGGFSVEDNQDEVELFDNSKTIFTTDLEDEIRNIFPKHEEVKRSYEVVTGKWYVAQNISSFREVLTGKYSYYIPTTKNSYEVYSSTEHGLEWIDEVKVSSESKAVDFSNLTYDTIEEALKGISYNDYVITYSQSLYTIFIWARGDEQEYLLTYPAREDLVGLTSGRIYTLKEAMDTLKEFYHNEN